MKPSLRLAAALCALVLLLTAVSLAPMAMAAEDASDAPAVVFTEICFNPAYEENEYGLSDSADVFEYVEICNRSDTPVSLAALSLARSHDGYDGSFRTMPLLPPDKGDAQLAPGETAVIAIPTGDSYGVGLRTDTEAHRADYYQRFAAFFGCADRLPPDRFLLADNRDNETGEAYDYGFNLANSTKDVILRLLSGEELLCEVNYSAATWNRNGFSLNLTYRPGGVEGHPAASAPYNVGACTPGLLRDNQITTEGMTPVGETVDILAMQYNICATDSTQTDTDGSEITMEERIGHAFDVIRGYDPDILCLCEVNYLWVPRLKEEMTGEGGAYAGHGRSSKGISYNAARVSRETWDLFNLILWKTETYELVNSGTFWCSATTDKANSYTWEDGLVGDFARGINWVILRDRATGGEFFVLCAHIDAKVAESRRRSAALIVKMANELAEGRPILMFGDWNANERSSAYAELTSGGIADARYRISDPAAMTLRGTTNGWGGYSDFISRAPIDHCLVSAHNVYVTSATSDPGYFDEAGTLVSADHNATVFELQAALFLDPTETETDVPPPEETDTETETVAESAAPEPPSETQPATAAPQDTQPSDGTLHEPSDTAGCGSVLSGSAVLLGLLPLGILARRRESSDET